jgi:hypothetical protein
MSTKSRDRLYGANIPRVASHPQRRRSKPQGLKRHRGATASTIEQYCRAAAMLVPVDLLVHVVMMVKLRSAPHAIGTMATEGAQ